MKKEELEAILKQGDLEPIEGYLEMVATEPRLPVVAIGMCLLRMEEAAPPLRALVARAANGESLSDEEVVLLFRGLYILGGGRDTAACRDLLRLLRRPESELDDVLGDVLTESMARIVAGVFDGDVDALFGLVADRSVDQFARDQIFGAATFLTWDGRIELDRMRRLLVAFYEDKLAEDEDQAWYGWQQAIALLGLRDLAPMVHRAIDDGCIPDWMLGRGEFDDLLAEAEQRPEDISRFEEAHLGYIADVVEALEWTDHDDTTDQLSDDDLGTQWIPTEPVRNPLRHVGRNDPCPCGSGKKYKKCCLTNQP
ncbi:MULTISPECIES: DUF1186 domain-containing protein [unclassified Bradyrhizobium]|uniref:DUF1186 domain-containing protein n=1 Tax=unclassified Bradyrhizobium TaxID=2631580 RepID=UPI002479F734|nr:MULTISPECIES: DUF1186 domain-containing protein [unclassified Bradyrhizobium]WGS20547.1 DUF1186 domain-containing protein [Bradyrhizobium sp. ISRA463]WGS27432.1 DUF1186 domain-containing protein [Bradyrhizobium sp. ISRA464]